MNRRTTGEAVAADSAWAHPLVRHLAAIIALKLAALFLLWFLFFRPPDGAPAPGSDIHDHIAGSARPAVSTQNNEVRP
jgi:hypothetical protein